VSKVVESIAPARLGKGFRWLLGASWVSNLGDGIGVAAGPLLVASQTKDPALVAAASLLQYLPWLLFGLYAGVLSDRLDRRRLTIAGNIARAGVLGVLATAIIGDVVNVWVVLAALFLLGTAESLVDTAASTLLPMLVEPEDLGVGNARFMFGSLTLNRLAGPPIGAALFGLGLALPFVTQAVLMAFSALLVARMALTHTPATTEHAPVRRDIADGIRWVWHHPPMRTLALTIITFNVTFGAAWAVLVLYATERLGMGDIGFGLLTTTSAVGGVLGTAAYGWLERHLGLANIMRAGLIIETATHLTLALTRTPAVALAIFFVFGAHEAAWGTTSITVRQRAVPTEFQGRVASVYMAGVFGGLVVGSALGGLLAKFWGLTGPFWFAFVGSALILVTIWRELGHIAHAQPEPASSAVAG
jgi:MFS family permease